MGSLFIIVGICALVYGLIVPRVQVTKTMSWPSVTGIVAISKVNSSRSGNEMFGTTNTYHSAVIKYKYQVDGRKYINDRVHAGGSYSSSIPSVADELADRYYVGAEVDVYYDPDKPSKSCLERSEETSLFYMGIGVFFIVFGFMVN